MPITLFLSDEEYQRCSHDVSLVAQKADAFIRELYNQIETVKAQADAASITAEQTCSLLEQKYVSLSSEFASLQSQHSQLSATLEQRLSELAQLQADKHQIHLQSIGKDGEIERLSLEASELHKSKRQLMELMEHKESEIAEKNAGIKSYLDKIVTMTENSALRESRISDLEAELARSNASCARLSQEKEIVDRHNAWLNEELNEKGNSYLELRKVHNKLEADMYSKLADLDRKYNENVSLLKWKNDRVEELESKLTSMQEELCSCKDAAAVSEERFSAEVSTVNKLVELYKESSEEWSKKAGELEGVIKALETHAGQLEKEYREKLEKEMSIRKEFEKEAAIWKEKLEKCEEELERSRNSEPLKLFQMTSFNSEVSRGSIDNSDMDEDNRLIVPSIPAGISGTALAASLLRDGWSLVKMYEKYQEAVDALRHEQLGRKQSQSILERVLYEIEEKAGVILDERAEHDRMVEAYSAVNQKLQHSLSEQAALERTIQELKADLRRHERDYSLAQKEILDLQKQVAVLLKECRDIQVRCGSVNYDNADERMMPLTQQLNVNFDAENVIPERLLTFKDINGLVEQNVQLRSLTRLLSEQVENKEAELKEKFEKELQEHSNQAASKVDAVLARAEEQSHMIESLHTSVAMYKKLYEEEHRHQSSYLRPQETVSEDGRSGVMLLLEGSHEAAKKAQEHTFARLKCLEEELTQLKGEIIALRSQRDKLALEANFAQEKLDRFMREFEHQREETNGTIARNVEFSQIIIDYQRKLREGSESLHSAQELSRKLSMEVSVLKNEKEVLLNSEKRACEEVRSLSERVHRLQATLDTIQSAEEVREEARCAQRRNQEDYVKRIEREWAEAKQELQEERDNVRRLTLERESMMKGSLQQIEVMGKELANALHAVTDANARAATAEARCSELEKTRLDVIVSVKNGESTSSSSSNEIMAELQIAKEEIEKLREEAQVNKDHMLQYKSIAQVNEAALKQMEVSHEDFKVEAEKVKKLLEDELLSLKERVNELQNDYNMKAKEVVSAAASQEEALASSLSEVVSLREECSMKASAIATLELQMAAMNDDLEKGHKKWRGAQDNYERQVILLSETIQELTKTSQALASMEEQASELRKTVDSLTVENKELRTKWETEKLVLEKSRDEALQKFNEIDEQNKILHTQLEALHIKVAEKDRGSAGISSGGINQGLLDDAGLQNVVKYLRRSKEIAETEISLLKQEKLRLQSQLDSALKAEETAQEFLRAERANSRSLLFTEEEFKALQLQVREMNLLRESNIQLREENKHNFEECQILRQSAEKLRMEIGNLEGMLGERQTEVEAFKREIEQQNTEKMSLEKRVDELLERFKNITPEEYDQMHEDVKQIQANLREKDGHLEELNKVVADKQGVILRLEKDLARSKEEANEKELRITSIMHAETSLKSDVERLKKLNSQLKRRNEILLKEKEDISSKNQNLSKELEESQSKRSTVDTLGEQAMREREEKDTRIQILEKILEKARDDLKKEKEEYRAEKAKHQKTQKIISDSYKTVAQEKLKLTEEFEKHKQAFKVLSDKVEKLKHASEPGDTAVVQPLSGFPFDNFAAAYLLAVDNFEQFAHQLSSDFGVATTAETSSADPSSSLGDTANEIVPSLAPNMLIPVVPPVHSAGERQKLLDKPKPKPKIETRKVMRKLVRPSIVKPEQPKGDVSILETDGASHGGKPTSAPNNDIKANLAVEAESSVRKRSSSLVASDDQDVSLVAQDSNQSDIAAPVLKKSRGLEQSQECPEVHAEVPEAPFIADEAMDHVREEIQGMKEEAVDDERDEEVETGEEHTAEAPKVLGDNQVEMQEDRSDAGEESLNIPCQTEVSEDHPCVIVAEQDMTQQAMDEAGSEPEEGELVADVIMGTEDGAAGSSLSSDIVVTSHEIGQAQPAESLMRSPSPAQVDDEASEDTAGEMEISSPQMTLDEDNDGKIEGDVRVEEIAHDSSTEKPKADADGNMAVTPVGTAIAHVPKIDASIIVASGTETTSNNSAVVEVGVSNQEGSSTIRPSPPDSTEAKQESVADTNSRIINLSRAGLRSRERMGAARASPSPSSGRARQLQGPGSRRGRGRGGQTPGSQGM